MMAQANYVGIDIEVPSKPLPASFEDARFIHGDLLKIGIPKGQVVWCVETLGINTLFDLKQMQPAIVKLSEAVDEGGALIFNASKLNARDVSWVRDFLAQNYSASFHHRYGRGTPPRPIFFSIWAASVMFFSERKRVPNSSEEHWHVFMALGKKAEHPYRKGTKSEEGEGF